MAAMKVMVIDANLDDGRNKVDAYGVGDADRAGYGCNFDCGGVDIGDDEVMMALAIILISRITPTMTNEGVGADSDNNYLLRNIANTTIMGLHSWYTQYAHKLQH